MKAIAIRRVKFNCNGNLYDCEQGQEVEILPQDVEKAKASRLFEIVEEKPKRKTTKKAD